MSGRHDSGRDCEAEATDGKDQERSEGATRAHARTLRARRLTSRGARAPDSADVPGSQGEAAVRGEREPVDPGVASLDHDRALLRDLEVPLGIVLGVVAVEEADPEQRPVGDAQPPGAVGQPCGR